MILGIGFERHLTGERQIPASIHRLIELNPDFVILPFYQTAPGDFAIDPLDALGDPSKRWAAKL